MKFTRHTFKKMGLGGIMILTLSVFFQNCGDIGLQAPEVLPSTVPIDQFSGKVCASQNPNGRFFIKSFFIANMNGVRRGPTLLLDSDSDGMPDSLEPTTATDPRVNGLLDVLAQGCASPTSCVTNCANTILTPGLTGCDLAQFSPPVLTVTPKKGFDMDMDGIPDLLEVLSRTDPIRDSTGQYSHGGTMSDYESVQNGLDANSFTQPNEAHWYRYSTPLSDEASDACPSQAVSQIRIDNYPLPEGDTLAFTDALTMDPNFNLSHEAGEMVLGFFMISEDFEGVLPSELYVAFKRFRRDPGIDFTLRPADFKLVGPVTQ